jgi:hypothetical protein
MLTRESYGVFEAVLADDEGPDAVAEHRLRGERGRHLEPLCKQDRVDPALSE